MLILALGGHEFSRRRGNEALRDYMLALVETERPRICLLPTASGDTQEQIAAFRRSMGSAGLPGVGCLPVQARGRARRPPRASPAAGHRLRRRGQHGQHARGLARSRHRPHSSRGVAGRDAALRSERRRDVLVRVGHHALHGGGSPRSRSWPASWKPVRPPSPRPRPPTGPAPGRLACDSARLRSRRPGGAAVPGQRAGGSGQRQARGGCVAGRERRRGRLDGGGAGNVGGSPTRARQSTSRMRTWPSCGAPSRPGRGRAGASNEAGWAR